MIAELLRGGRDPLRDQRIRDGVEKYRTIMCIYKSATQVLRNSDFKKLYKSFYRVRRPSRWCKSYFSILDKLKKHPMTFKEILQALYDQTGKVEASFASKMLATSNPASPVIDKWVLANLSERLPYQYEKNRIEKVAQLYGCIVKEYRRLLASDEGKRLVTLFDDSICLNSRITNVKKVDLILWQTRRNPRSRG